MSYSLKSLKGSFLGDYIGEYYKGYQGHTWRIDQSSSGVYSLQMKHAHLLYMSKLYTYGCCGLFGALRHWLEAWGKGLDASCWRV